MSTIAQPGLTVRFTLREVPPRDGQRRETAMLGYGPIAWISRDDSLKYRETMICIAVKYAFSGAGISPANLHCAQKHKNTGGTPALPRPRPKHLFSCGVTAARTFVRNAG